VLEFARKWQPMATGAPFMAEEWVLGWLAWNLGREKFPANWRRIMPLDWRRQWREFKAKSRRLQAAGGGNSPRPENPVARRIALERRARALEEELQSHALNCSAPPFSEAEKADFERVRSELRQTKLELEAD
jgi:hypothetical protein